MRTRMEAAISAKEPYLPYEGYDYKWAAKYAADLYGMRAAAWKALDEKADSILKHLGGGAGLLTIATMLTIKEATLLTFVGAMVPVFFALLAVVFAALARRPSLFSYPQSVAVASQYVDSYGPAGEAAFLEQWHVACKALAENTNDKSWYVNLATSMMIGTIATLWIPAIIVMMRAPP